MALLHPAFDPDLLDTPFDRPCAGSIEDQLVQQIEQEVAIELRSLQAVEAGNAELRRFICLLQQVRDDQVRIHARIDRIAQLLAGE